MTLDVWSLLYDVWWWLGHVCLEVHICWCLYQPVQFSPSLQISIMDICLFTTFPLFSLKLPFQTRHPQICSRYCHPSLQLGLSFTYLCRWEVYPDTLVICFKSKNEMSYRLSPAIHKSRVAHEGQAPRFIFASSVPSLESCHLEVTLEVGGEPQVRSRVHCCNDSLSVAFHSDGVSSFEACKEFQTLTSHGVNTTRNIDTY